MTSATASKASHIAAAAVELRALAKKARDEGDEAMARRLESLAIDVGAMADVQTAEPIPREPATYWVDPDREVLVYPGGVSERLSARQRAIMNLALTHGRMSIQDLVHRNGGAPWNQHFIESRKLRGKVATTISRLNKKIIRSRLLITKEPGGNFVCE